MASVRVARNTNDSGKRLRGHHVQVVFDASDAVEFGRWLQTERHGDVALGDELVIAGHEVWERDL